MSVKIELYQAIKTKLEAISGIKNVLHYNGQDQFNYEKDNSKRFPQAWIQLTNINWLPSELTAYNSNVTQQQKSAEATITIYLASYSLNEDDETFEDDLLLIDETYRALTNLGGDNFSPLQRVSENDVADNNNVRVWAQEYNCMLTECGVSPGLADAAPVALTINKEIFIREVETVGDDVIMGDNIQIGDE